MKAEKLTPESFIAVPGGLCRDCFFKSTANCREDSAILLELEAIHNSCFEQPEHNYILKPENSQK